MGHAITIFSALYLPSYGGVEQFSANLARELLSEGHEVSVVTCDTAGLGPYETTEDGVRLFRMPCRPVAGGRLPLPRHGRAYARLWREVRAIPADGVLVNTRFYPHSVLGLRYAREQGLRAVLLDHGSSHLGFGDPRIDWAVRRYEHLATARTKRYHPDYYGISDKSLAWLSHFGIEGKGVIHNAIDAPAFRALASPRDIRRELGIPEEDLVVAFTGRLVVDKGTDCLVGIAEELARRGRAAHLVVAGVGPEQEAMAARVLPNLHLLGRLERADVSALLRSSDVFVLPSKTEGMPTSVLEAAAWGVSSVTCAVGGVREIMPDESFGMVVEDVDPVRWADILDGYLSNREELARKGERCRERVEQCFCWPQTAAAVLDAFEAARRSVGE